MELREFVAITLSAILDGVEDAIRDAPKDRQGKIAPIIEGEEDYLKDIRNIEFNLAVSCENDKGSSSEKTRIRVLPLEDGGETSKTSEGNTGSRIKFCVPIIYGGQRIGRT